MTRVKGAIALVAVVAILSMATIGLLSFSQGCGEDGAVSPVSAVSPDKASAPPGMPVLSPAVPSLTAWHCAPAPQGTYPISHYVWQFTSASPDTNYAIYLARTLGLYTVKVAAVDDHGLVGPWSVVAVSNGIDNSPTWPGVSQ